jgi:hypothetical protein
LKLASAPVQQMYFTPYELMIQVKADSFFGKHSLVAVTVAIFNPPVFHSAKYISTVHCLKNISHTGIILIKPF